jgi:hypothetical protein
MEPLANHGLWFAMLLFMAARGLVYLDIERGAGFDAAPSRPASARR